jgi:hypothetical protein
MAWSPSAIALPTPANSQSVLYLLLSSSAASSNTSCPEALSKSVTMASSPPVVASDWLSCASYLDAFLVPLLLALTTRLLAQMRRHPTTSPCAPLAGSPCGGARSFVQEASLPGGVVLSDTQDHWHTGQGDARPIGRQPTVSGPLDFTCLVADEITLPITDSTFRLPILISPRQPVWDDERSQLASFRLSGTESSPLAQILTTRFALNPK